ncbi:MAG TPA: PAS domain S-box protein, partial [Cyanophyceae cyanobacterium]
TWLRTHEETPKAYSQELKTMVEQIPPNSLASNDRSKAQALLLDFNTSNVAVQFDDFVQHTTKLIEIASQEDEDATARLEKIQIARNLIIAASTLLSLAIAAAIATHTSRAIAHPITLATQVTRRVIRETNFDLQVPLATEDEIGQLTHSLNQLFQDIASYTQDLKQAQAELDRFFNLSLDLFCIVSFDGRFKRLNCAFEATLGYTRRELLSLPLVDLIHPQDRAATQTQVYKLLADEPVNGIESRYRCKDGSYKWLSWAAVPFTPEGLIYIVARDVSEQNQIAEKLLCISKAIESTSDAIGMTDLTGQAIYHNPAFIDLFEYTVDELAAAGGPPAIYADETDAHTVFAAIQSGHSWQGEVAMHSRRGRRMQISLRANAIKDQTGQIIGLISIYTDITEHKQFEEELRQSEANFRDLATREALLNQLANQIRRSLDLNTILETAVCEIRDLLQIDRCLFMWYRPDEVQPVWEIVQEAKISTFPSLISYRVPVTTFGPLTARIFNKEITRVDSARMLTDPVERKFFFSVGYTALLTLPIHTHYGAIGAVSCSHSSGARPWRDSEVELLQAVADQLAIALDQAELLNQSHLAAVRAQEQAAKLEQALRELQQTQAQLVHSEKMSSLGQLVAGVAHEINNPISFIYGNLTHTHQYAEDLLRLLDCYQKYYPNPAPEIQAEAEAIDVNFIREDMPKILASMEVGVDRIRQIVLSLRKFSRLDEAAMKWVDIHEGLDSTLLILAHRLKGKSSNSSDIKVIKDYGNLPKIQCHAGPLNQVFMNILANAIDAIENFHQDYFPEPNKKRSGIIWICTQVIGENQAIILIGDNGSGMTPEVCQKLFDPFFTTKPVGSGTGLGMSISYQIVVQKHGGKLQCISAPGQGTAFLIQIPIQQTQNCLPSSYNV